MEAWEEGESLSLSLLCGSGEADLLSINRQRIDTDADGCVHYRGVAIDAVDRASACGRAMNDLARRIVRAIPGLAGFVGIDVVLHPQRGPIVIEVNPRVTCSYVGLSAALARNVAGDVLERHEQAPLRQAAS
jgi:tyramine---L-glutamate ligase